ncbi:helical backbone metal receptor [Pseudogracilibacillus sp. ICA-222130]|uniref:helical backbone metal receptor n=1 Tax=Pseudogracilibacillus sp. ICA-222130 TaxID=3134655 RepID=UPI0030BCD31A
MKTVVDHLGRTVTVPKQPKKIISFAPAITDTLFSLHLEEEIVGRTRFCVHPKEKVASVMNVGGTKDMNLDRVRALQPDLIITEKEENTKEMVEQLEKEFSVFVFEIQTVEDALNMILDLGKLVDRVASAKLLYERIIEDFATIPSHYTGKRVAYVIWKDPYMVVGKNTYIQSLLNRLGFINPFLNYEGRYPEVTVEDLRAEAIDYFLLASEPYPFREKHREEFLNIDANAVPLLVDGEMFWYGAKMLRAVEYFKTELA